ncbi:MAG: hypothetical protein HQK50_11700 [Oligoflexia bacterium]|nr:hypothetical protein [Oligoflexia bacterium]MBF0366228.1 hypothetical protein [Oligoflexia bacterium]
MCLVSCYIIATGNEVFFVDDITSISIKIAITDTTVFDKLLEKVPCCVGGKYIYADKVEADGVVVINPDGLNTFSKIYKMTVIRGDEKIIFSLLSNRNSGI